jgi:membrane-associated phospholipid phosphatase
MNDYIFGQLGIDIIKFLQSFSNPILDIFFQVITLAGDVPFYLVILALIYWLESKNTGAHLAAALIIFGYITGLIKGIIGWTRPYLAHPAEVEAIGTANGYSFPSGHSQSTATFWPLLINRCTSEKRKKLLIPTGIFFLVLVPISRMYLGVHYPSDVITGLLIGILGVYLYIKINPVVIAKFKDANYIFLLIITFVLSIGMVLVEIFSVSFTNHDLTISDPGLLPGMFFGALGGFILEKKYVNFSEKPSEKMFYVTRIIIGGLIVALCYIIPHFLFGVFQDFENIDIIRHYVEYTAIGLGIAVIGPLVFIQFEK